jgi:hypothetical protein
VEKGVGVAMAHMSWNGATDVARWEILSGKSADRLRSVGSSPSAGLETMIPVQLAGSWVVARAMDSAGASLADSGPVQV